MFEKNKDVFDDLFSMVVGKEEKKVDKGHRCGCNECKDGLEEQDVYDA